MAKKAKDSTPGIYRKRRARWMPATAENIKAIGKDLERSFAFVPVLDEIEQACVSVIRPHVSKSTQGAVIDLGEGLEIYSIKRGAPDVVRDAISAMDEIRCLRMHLGEDSGNIRAVGLFALRLGMLCERMSVRPYEGHVRHARKMRENLWDRSISDGERQQRVKGWHAQILQLMSFRGHGLKFSDALSRVAEVAEKNPDHVRRELKRFGITRNSMRKEVEAEMGIEKT
jgi:hypothetical protein